MQLGVAALLVAGTWSLQQVSVVPQRVVQLRRPLHGLRRRQHFAVSKLGAAALGDVGRVMPLVEEVLGDTRVQKVAVWIGFVCLMRLLEPFYSVIFMTFLFTFVGASAVNGARHLYGSWARRMAAGLARGRAALSRDEVGRTWARGVLERLDAAPRDRVPWAVSPPRQLFAAAYIAAVVLSLTTLSLRYGPLVVREAQYVTTLLTTEDPYLAAASAIRSGLGDKRAAQLEVVARSIADQTDFFAALSSPTNRGVSTEKLSGTLRRLATPHFVELGALGSTLLRPVPSLLYEGLTAALFSLLIVWDLPEFAASLNRLGESRRPWIRFAFREISPRVASFARLLGTNFEIQGLIAVVNTILTTAGFWFLDISGTRFLTLLVFVCSFIPVVGVFVSTFPACVLALAEHGGLRLAQVIAMVLFVHFVEAYLLYPQIYASKLKVHPLLVLVSLDSRRPVPVTPPREIERTQRPSFSPQTLRLRTRRRLARLVHRAPRFRLHLPGSSRDQRRPLDRQRQQPRRREGGSGMNRLRDPPVQVAG